MPSASSVLTQKKKKEKKKRLNKVLEVYLDQYTVTGERQKENPFPKIAPRPHTGAL